MKFRIPISLAKLQTLAITALLVLTGAVQPAVAQSNFAGKDLSRRDLRTENFEDANLSDANLDYSDLTDVILKNADLRNAFLTGTRMAGADLSGADLRGSRFSAFTQNANFAGANMEGLDLAGISFRNCNLRGANLRNTKNIADITFADLRGADLRGAYLLNARDYNGNSVKLEGAKYDRRTRFPQWLDIEKSGAVKVEDPTPIPTPGAVLRPLPPPSSPPAAEAERNTRPESTTVGAPQNYAVGDKVEAYVYYSWKKATIVRVVLDSRYSNFEVEIETADGKTGAGISHFHVSNDNVRPYGETDRLAPRAAKSGEGPRLGNYSIYSYGANAPLYLGHVLLEKDGTYKVSRSSSGAYFGGGRYSFDAATSTVRWLSGPYKDNGWGGKFEIVQGGKGHTLELTEGTIASNYNEK